MSLAWFICPYNRRVGTQHPTRYCAMDDFTAQILADGGNWSETEVLGSNAVVKVNASDTTLTTIAGTTGFFRIPNHFVLSDFLGDLTTNQKNTIRNKLTSMGYSTAEINAVLPAASSSWAGVTLEQLLNLAATRRLKPRYDVATDTIILDGSSDPVRPVRDVDKAVN